MFYVLEGIDGSGKTSVGSRIAQISPIVYSEITKEKSKHLNAKPTNTFHEIVSYFMSSSLNLIAGLNPDVIRSKNSENKGLISFISLSIISSII